MISIVALEGGNVRSRHTGGGVVGLLLKNPKLNFPFYYWLITTVLS